MGEKMRELETKIMSLSFMNEFLMNKLAIHTEEIQQFAKKCLEHYEGDKNTDTYYFLLGVAYQEKAKYMIRDVQLKK